MTKVLIVYATDYGNTKKMAEAVASGVTSVSETDVEVKFADDVTEDDGNWDCKLKCVKGEEMRSNEQLDPRHSYYDFST
ncbi:flavodoxin domain-containing protein [Phormidium tenue FACHB-886]|nr:flavodoxin domain-containing protein [Phormidium tenue FACHB-886]